jgi:pSer/pThr/pTyr-binding forkhead associated (FHA) protein
MLPPQGTIVIGRWSFDTDLPLVDVDLSYFFASAKGVSRRHIMITRKNQLVYLTDLNTRNGTWLNDQPLVAYNARLLRNNDRLRLGSLNMRVLFGEISWPPDSVVHVSDNPSAWQA